MTGEGTYAVKILLFALLLSVSPFVSHAQLVPELGGSIVLTVNPQFPKPGDEVVISAESFSFDLDRSVVSWFLNDSLQQQEEGVAEFRFVAGPLGSISTIDIVAETESGALEQEQISIRPTEIDLLWQADSFKTPFYEGKALPSLGGKVTVLALPNFIDSQGRKISNESLIYTWRYNGSALPQASGKGKSSTTVVDLKPSRSAIIDVEVTSQDGILAGKSRISLPVFEPKIVIYEQSPLLGTLFNAAVRNSFTLSTNEIKLVAYPFFMSLTRRGEGHINYSWQLGRDEIPAGDDPGSITVSHEGGSEGEAEISLEINNARDFLQEASKRFTIYFGGQN